eukprot:393698-Rhodomonas_salina.7
MPVRSFYIRRCFGVEDHTVFPIHARQAAIGHHLMTSVSNGLPTVAHTRRTAAWIIPCRCRQLGPL